MSDHDNREFDDAGEPVFSFPSMGGGGNAGNTQSQNQNKVPGELDFSNSGGEFAVPETDISDLDLSTIEGREKLAEREGARAQKVREFDQAEKAEIQREINDGYNVSLERFGEERIGALDQILQAALSEEEYSQIGDSGLGSSPAYIGALLEHEPELERLMDQVKGLDLTHPSNRDAQLRFKSDLRELVSRALSAAETACARRYGPLRKI